MNISEKPWWVWILLINAVFITVTTVWPHVDDPVARLLSPGSLQFERNLAVWWAGMCLLLTSLLSYELYSSGQGWVWLPVGAVFLGLSFDEMGSVHERASWYLSRTQIYLLLFAGFLALVPAAWRLFWSDVTRPTAVLLLLGFLLMLTAVPHEYIETQVGVPAWAMGLRVGLEEGSELMGTFLCMFAVARQRSDGDRAGGLSSMLPNPLLMRRPTQLLAIAALGHVAIAALTVATVDVGYRGDPAVYLPSAMLLVGFLACVPRGATPASARRSRLSLAALFLLGSIFTFVFLSPAGVRGLSSGQEFVGLWLPFLTIGVAFALGVRDSSGSRRWVPGTAVAVMMVIALYWDDPLVRYLAAGVAASALALAALDEPNGR